MVDILKIVQLLISIVLASQGIFYALGLAQAVKNISIPAFAEQRNAIDEHIAIKLKFLYYGALILGIVVLILLKEGYHSSTFVFLASSTMLTMADIVLAVKFNIPINKAFKSYPGGVVDWNTLRARWIRFILIRGVLSIGAMLLLLLASISL